MTKKIVLLDTNFFMVPFQLNIDVMAELERLVPGDFEMVTLEPLYKELNNLTKNAKGADKSAARLAFEFAKGVRKIPSDFKGDDSIVNFAKNDDCIICSNDSALRKRLKGKTLVCVKGGKKLDFC
jgi:uncharacterized protein